MGLLTLNCQKISSFRGEVLRKTLSAPKKLAPGGFTVPLCSPLLCSRKEGVREAPVGGSPAQGPNVG